MTRHLLVLLLATSSCAADAPGGEAADGLRRPPPVSEPTPILTWSFEPASADCNGWAVVGGEGIRATPPRSGAYACKICSDGSAAELGLVRDVGTVPAGRYAVSLWVRRRVQNAAPDEAKLRLEADVSGVAVSAAAGPTVVRDEWERLETSLDLSEPASNLRITVDAPSSEPARCMLVDDVLLTRE